MLISVITPSLNPRKEFIQRVFEGLQQQTLPLRQWEYVVVDSGNNPPLRERFDLSWHPNACIIEAPEKRLAVSRLRGMEKASGDLIVFVDDDNVLECNYLEEAMREMALYPFIGVLGGYIEAEFQGGIEPWMHDFLPILGALQFQSGPHEDLCYAKVKSAGPWVPAGSGMIVRRSVADEYSRQVVADPNKLVIGRVGDQLLGSDDVDLAYTAIDMSLAIGRSRRPCLKHLIPETRLSLTYLLRLLYASNYATASLLVRRGWKTRCPLPPVGWLTKVYRRISSLRSRPPEQQCWIAFAKGYQDGLAGVPFDQDYR